MPHRPPNLMLLVGEDVGRHHGCYGDRFARTPHLDRLATQGCRFTSAWSTTPVCAPARSSLVTGCDPRRIGTHLMRSARRDPPKTFMHALREAGYFVNWANKTDFNDGGGYSAPDPGKPGAYADAAGDWEDDLAAGRLPDRPWLLFKNFNVTHESQAWPPEHTAGTPATEPRAGDATLDGLDELDVPPWLPDTRTVRAALVRYHDALEQQDRQIGVALAALERSGQADRTVVVYLSDHGRGLPREKRWCYPAGVRMPLIVRGPGVAGPGITEAGTTRDDLVSWVDLAPTLLALAGVPPMVPCDGRVFLGPDTGPEPDQVFFGRDRMDEAQDRVRGAATRRHLYLHNGRPDIPWMQRNAYMETSPVTAELRRLHRDGALAAVSADAAAFFAPVKPDEEFYDLDADPHALNNLAGRPEVESEQNVLRDAFADHARAIDDLGLVPESDLIAQGILDDQRDFYRGRVGVVPQDLDPDGTYATRYDPDRV